MLPSRPNQRPRWRLLRLRPRLPRGRQPRLLRLVQASSLYVQPFPLKGSLVKPAHRQHSVLRLQRRLLHILRAVHPRLREFRRAQLDRVDLLSRAQVDRSNRVPADRLSLVRAHLRDFVRHQADRVEPLALAVVNGPEEVLLLVFRNVPAAQGLGKDPAGPVPEAHRSALEFRKPSLASRCMLESRLRSAGVH